MATKQIWHVQLAKNINEYEYLLNGTVSGKKKNQHPYTPKSQNPIAVNALLPLITEVIPLNLILCILKLFPQSLNNANNSSSMEEFLFSSKGRKSLVSWFTKLYLVAIRQSPQSCEGSLKRMAKWILKIHRNSDTNTMKSKIFFTP